MKVARAGLVVVLFACGASTTTTSSAPTPLPSVASAAPSAPRAPVCDDDVPGSIDCATLQLGQCSAGVYYACPSVAKLPAGFGLRATIASRVTECLGSPGYDGAIDKCVPTLEACVRKAVESSCVDEDELATCARELATCPEDEQRLCAKFLTSLEPKSREKALDDMRQQRKMTGDASTCAFDWDLNGFPFCPFCPFTGRRGARAR